MKLLALDTSSAACSVALLDTTQPPERQISSDYQVMPMQQGKLVLPMIHNLLKKADLTVHDLDAISYGYGPGSLTGVRLACNLTQGISYVTHCRIIPVSSMAALAQAAHLKYHYQALYVALDARMGEVYTARYQVGANGLVSLIGVEKVLLPDSIHAPEQDVEWHGIGDGWEKYGEILSRETGIMSSHIHSGMMPSAEAILPLASFKYEQRDWISAFDAYTNYLR